MCHHGGEGGAGGSRLRTSAGGSHRERRMLVWEDGRKREGGSLAGWKEREENWAGGSGQIRALHVVANPSAP